MTSELQSLNNQYLKYGYGVVLQSSTESKEKFFLAARGKHSSQVYFLKENKPLRGGQHLFQELPEMTFVITPQLSFDANIQFQESKKDDLKRQLYRKRKKNEDELNETTIREAYGKPVKLGDMVQLYHPITKQYLEFSIVKGDHGSHNILILSNKKSKQIQFKINSPLTFRKKGTPILVGDELYLASASEKTLVYCNNKDLMDKLAMNLGDNGGSWFGGGVNERDFKVPHVTELQHLMQPIQAGNISLNSVGGEYSNKIKFLNLSIPDVIEKDRTSFKWGDIVILSKLEESGKQNLLFAETNSSGYDDSLFFETLKGPKHRHLRGYEHYFQITPKNPDLYGETIQFNDDDEVKIFLKHMLSGKFIHFEKNKGFMSLSQDFGVSFAQIESRKSSLRSEYKDKIKIFKRILENDKIKNKDEEIMKNFTNQEVKLFKNTDSILESEERYIDQYYRDLTLVLKKVSYGESKDLQTSTYFTIKSFSGDKLRVEESEEVFKSFLNKSGSKDKYFQASFSYEEKYNTQFPMICKKDENPDFFFFDRNDSGVLDHYRTTLAIIPDLIKFIKGDLRDKKNLANMKKIFDFLDSIFFNPDIDRTRYQHFLRQASVIDLLMAVLQRIEDRSLRHTDEEIFIPFFSKIIRFLQMICYNNKASAEYVYQWKKFFSNILEEKIEFGDQFVLDEFVSEIFEMNNNYQDYMQIKLDPLCNKLIFTNYDFIKLKLLLSMLKSSRRLKDTKLDEYVVSTLIKDKNRKRIFFPFKNEAEVTIFDHNGKKVLEMSEFVIDSKKNEINYIIDLVKVAVTLTEMAPTKVSGKIEEMFPKDVCLKIIADPLKPGNLRGEFLKLFKMIYVDSHVRKYELSVIESYINVGGSEGNAQIGNQLDTPEPNASGSGEGSGLDKEDGEGEGAPLKNKKTSYRAQREQWIAELREKVLRHEEINLIDLVVEKLESEISEFTEATMDFALYLLTNDLLTDEETQSIDVALKDILLKKGKKLGKSKPKKIKQPKKSLSSKKTKGVGRSAEYLLSNSTNKFNDLSKSNIKQEKAIPLQRRVWLPNLFRCLIQIENLKNNKRRQHFLNTKSKELKIDSHTLVNKLNVLMGEKRQQHVLSNRDVTKDYMDGLTNSDPAILAVVVELLNPELHELTEIMLKFMDMQIRRDEIIMMIYKKRYELVDPPGPLKSDFQYFYIYSLRMKRSALQIMNFMNEKMTPEMSDRFGTFTEEICAMLSRVYFRISEGDAGKKVNELYSMLEDATIDLEEDNIKDGFVDKNDMNNGEEGDQYFYFNVLNTYLGNTQFYSRRKRVFSDLKMVEDIIRLILKLDSYCQIDNLEFKISEDIKMRPEVRDFEVESKRLEGSKFSQDFSNLMVKSLLLFNFIFLKSSRYAEQFMENHIDLLNELFELIMLKGGKFVRSLFLKFVSSILRDNYSFLLDLNIDFLNLVFRYFSYSIEEEDHQLTINILDIISNMVKYRNKIIVENSKIVCSKILDVFNSYGSKLRKFMTKGVVDWLRANELKKTIKTTNLTKFKWEKLHSKHIQFLEMTTEKTPIYKTAKVEGFVIVVYKILKIFDKILTYNDPGVMLLIKNSISLSLLQEIFLAAGDWFFIKTTVIDILKSLYVTKSMTERDINFIINGIINGLAKDLEQFRKFEENGKSSDSIYFVSNLDSFEELYLEDSVYKPYFDTIIMSKGNTWKDYITSSSTGLMKELVTKPKYTKNVETSFIRVFKHDYEKLNKVNNNLDIEQDEVFITNKNDDGLMFNGGGALLDGAVVVANNEGNKPINDLLSFGGGNKKTFTPGDTLIQRKNGLEVLKDDCMSELILVQNIYATRIMKYKLKRYEHLLEMELEKQIKADSLVELKEEVFPNDYLSKIVDADYDEFVDASLERFKNNNKKYHAFVRGLVELFEKRNQNFISLKRKINLVRKLIERDPDVNPLMEKLAEYGLFDKLMERYKENQYDRLSCLAIVDLIIFSINEGRVPVQKAIFGKFGHEIDNGFLNAVSRNLNLYFNKFVEREYIRAEFDDYYRAGSIHKKNVKRQIASAMKFINDHLELLRVFCEGHYKEMQEYLKFQTYRGIIRQNQVDMLDQIAVFLKRYSKILNSENVKLGQKILDFFVEVVQGPCKSNQVELSKSKVPDILEELSTSLIYEYPNISRNDRSRLLNSMILILLGLLENTKQQLIINKVSLNTNIEALWERLSQVYAQIHNETYIPKNSSNTVAKARRGLAMGRQAFEEQNIVKKEDKSYVQIYVNEGNNYSQEVEEALNIAILFSQLKTLNKSFKNNIEIGYNEKKEGVNKKLVAKARKFFFEKIRSIEIINQESELQKIYFAKPPLSRLHTNFSKEIFEDEVERGSSNEKLNGLIENVPFLMLELEHFNKLSRGPFSANFSIFFILQRFNFYFSLLLNVLLMLLPGISDESVSGTAFVSFGALSGGEKVIYILAWMLFASFGFTLVIWTYFSCGLKLRIIKLQENKSEEEQLLDGEKEKRNTFINFFVVSWKLLVESYLINILFLITMNLLGIFVSKLFFSFCLLDIVTISPSLKNIQKSILLNANALVVTVSFILILVFGFSSVTYFTKLRENYIFLEDDGLNLCYNFFQCFITLVNFGVRSGGGIGDLLLYPNYSEKTSDFLYRTIFDYLFFAIVVMILLSIVSAIIIDSFTELREMRDLKGKKLKNQNPINQFPLLCFFISNLIFRGGSGK